MPVFAMMFVASAGIAGVVVDGGHAIAEARRDQNAGDGASLAAAYTIAAGGTIAQANTAAGKIETLDGCTGTCSVSLSYLDSTGAVTTVPGSVASIAASVTDSTPKTLTKLISGGATTIGLSSSATAKLTGGTPSMPCLVCLLGTSGTTVSVSGSSSVVVKNGAILTASNGTPAYSATGGTTSMITALGTGASVGYVSGGSASATGSASIGSCTSSTSCTPSTPAAAEAAPIDPYATLAYPSVSTVITAPTTCSPTSSCSCTGSPGSCSCTGNTSCTFSPGVYTSLSEGGSGHVTLQSGTYVFTGGNFDVSGGGTVAGSNVMMYFTCSGYTTSNLSPCPSDGASGGGWTMSSGTLTLSTPSTGAYSGLGIFYDRHDTNDISFTGASAPSFGTMYAADAALDISGSAGTQASVVVNSVVLSGNTSLTIDQSVAGTGLAPTSGGTKTATLSQ